MREGVKVILNRSSGDDCLVCEGMLRLVGTSEDRVTNFRDMHQRTKVPVKVVFYWDFIV